MYIFNRKENFYTKKICVKKVVEILNGRNKCYYGNLIK